MRNVTDFKSEGGQSKMRTKVERCLCILIVFTAVLCLTVPTIVLAAERCNDILWLNGKTDDVAAISLNVYKIRIEKYLYKL